MMKRRVNLLHGCVAQSSEHKGFPNLLLLGEEISVPKMAVSM